MSKRETVKFIVQMIASIATAIVTALGATSCMGLYSKKSAEVPSPSADFFAPIQKFPNLCLVFAHLFLYICSV